MALLDVLQDAAYESPAPAAVSLGDEGMSDDIAAARNSTAKLNASSAAVRVSCEDAVPGDR